jgi:hypothetical protein
LDQSEPATALIHGPRWAISRSPLAFDRTGCGLLDVGLGDQIIRNLGIIGLGVALTFSISVFTTSARADCSDAVQSYNSAITDIESYLRLYTKLRQLKQGFR